jgi:DNA-binding response OmpR family regulator
MKILILDPDPRIRKTLERILLSDYVVDLASHAREAQELMSSSSYDLIIMDWLLPDMDADAFMLLARTESKEIPIIVISNHSSVSDKNDAFETGADDFLVKPIDYSELKSRIKALLRRKQVFLVARLSSLQVRDLVLDRNKKMVFYKNMRILLRKKELQVLEYFMLNSGRVVNRNDILENVWDSGQSPFTNTVEVHLNRLREKIEKPYNEKYFETVHGLGYIME